MRCQECGKQLTNKDDAYGHDCEVGMNKTVGMVAMMGDVIGGETLKEKNAWKTRMLKAGLSNKGLNFPDNWEGGIKETEKKKRLNKALKELMK
jgi:hypothetical protein